MAATEVQTPSAPSLTATPPPARVGPLPRATGFFQKPWPAALILVAFPLLALPMVAVVLFYPQNWLIWGYVWLFGMTHFVITLAVYARSTNLRYFASTPRNRAIFFLIPVLIFVIFDLYHAFRVGASLPLVGLAVLLAVRIADFNHFNRQSFGVMQLFKARTGVRYQPELKRAENLYFFVLTALLFTSYLAGGTTPLMQEGGWTGLPVTVTPFFKPIIPMSTSQPVALGLLAIAVGLFAYILTGLVRAGRGRRGLSAAVGYLLAQTAAACLAIIYFPLYLAALAVHYIEYHVLMARRSLRTEPEARSRLDRVMNGLRSRPAFFYMLIVAIAGIVTLAARAGMGAMGLEPEAAGKPFQYLAVIALFDGLFIFHYFVESFIWRFSDPHFRQEMSGLYFE